MKSVLALLLALVLSGCSNPSGRTVNGLGSDMRCCYQSLHRVYPKDKKNEQPESPDKTILQLLPAAVHDIPGAAGIFTW